MTFEKKAFTSSNLFVERIVFILKLYVKSTTKQKQEVQQGRSSINLQKSFFLFVFKHPINYCDRQKNLTAIR